MSNTKEKTSNVLISAGFLISIIFLISADYGLIKYIGAIGGLIICWLGVFFKIRHYYLNKNLKKLRIQFISILLMTSIVIAYLLFSYLDI
jgi:hypothetical protein